MTQPRCQNLNDAKCLLRRLGEENSANEAEACSLCHATLDDLENAAVATGGRLREAFSNSKDREREMHSGLSAPAARDALLLGDAGDDHGILPVIAGHEVHGVLGRGGMGIVYRGTQLDLDREVAIKFFATDKRRTSRQFTARFYREAQITAGLDHPSIVPVYSIGQDGAGRHYYTMRLVRGRRLDDILELSRQEKEGWNLSRAVAILVRVCQSIAFAHERQVIHRDLKPSNVMVGDLGEVYVLDWGLARILGKEDLRDIRPTTDRAADSPFESPAAEGLLMTMDGAVIGTPAYMPPEQAAGDTEQVDHLADVYALGAILYQLLTGHPPYARGGKKSSSRDLLRAVVAGPPPTVSSLGITAPDELAAICDKAMSRRRANRYGSALELAEDLQAFLDGHVVKAHQTGAWAELQKWFLRNRALAITGGAALLIAIAGLGATAVLQSQAAHHLFLANEDIRQSNEDLKAANAREQAAKKRESESAESERRAKQEALARLADSYANFGQQEAHLKRFAQAALWFTKAAELAADPQLAAAHRMRAFQFGRFVPRPIGAWWDREYLKKEGTPKPSFVRRFAIDPSGRYALATEIPVTRILDLGGNEPGLWTNRAYAAGAFSPSEGTVAIATPEGDIRILKLVDGSVVQTIPKREGMDAVLTLEFSRDGKLLLVGTKQARIWKVAEQRFLKGEYSLSSTVDDANFRPDGTQFIVNELPNDVRRIYVVQDSDGVHPPIESVDGGQRLAEVLEEFHFGIYRRHSMVSPDGHSLQGILPLSLVDPAKNVVGELPNQTLARGIHFAAAAPRFATMDDLEFLLLQDFRMPHRHWYVQSPYRVRARFSHNSQWLVAPGHPNYLAAEKADPKDRYYAHETQVYELASRQRIGALIKTDGPILDGQFSPDDNLLALACAVDNRSMETMFLPEGKGGNVQFWDWRKGERIGQRIPTPSEPRSIDWHPQLPLVAVACAAGQVVIVDMQTQTSTTLHETGIKNEAGRFFTADFSPGGAKFDPTGTTVVAYGLLGHTVAVDWKSKQLRFVDVSNFWTNDVAFRGGTALLSRSFRPGEVRRLATGEVLPVKIEWPNQAYLGRLSGNRWLMSGFGRAASLWDLDKSERACAEMDFGAISFVADFIHHTPYIIGGGIRDRLPPGIQVWDSHTGRPAAPMLEFPGNDANDLLVAPDGRHAAMTCPPHGLIVVDLRSFHEDPLRGLSPEESWLWAELQAKSTIRQGQLVALSLTEWIERWDDFRRRRPDFLRREDSREEQLRDHETRAFEIELLHRPNWLQYHRDAADRLRQASSQQP